MRWTVPAGFADHPYLEAAISASMIEEALNAGAAALDVEPTRIVDLDAGTGTGTLALAGRFPNAHVHSLDISTELLATLVLTAASAGMNDRVNTHRADLNDDWTGVVTAQVDVVWASTSLHHLENGPSSR